VPMAAPVTAERTAALVTAVPMVARTAAPEY
jgi:hypothetical protein